MDITIKISGIQTEAGQQISYSGYGNGEYAGYYGSGDSYQADQAYQKPDCDPVKDFTDGLSNARMMKTVFVLVAICAVLLVIPYTGALIRGMTDVLKIALYCLGSVAGLASLIVAVRMAYAGYWVHRKNVVEFGIWKRRTEMMVVTGTGTRSVSRVHEVEVLPNRGENFIRIEGRM